MNPTPGAEQFGQLARACATAADVDSLLKEALPAIAVLSGARAVLLVAGTGDAIAATGVTVSARDLGEQLAAARGEVVMASVPDAWTAAGLDSVATRRIADTAGVVVLGWESGGPG